MADEIWLRSRTEQLGIKQFVFQRQMLVSRVSPTTQ